MLQQYRNEIDAIDAKLVQLFEQRMDICKKVGEYKKEQNMEIFVPEREQAVVEKRTQQTKNAAYRPYVAEFFEGLMQISRKLQKTVVGKPESVSFTPEDVKCENLRVVYPGTAGSYSGEALKKCFPDAKEMINVPTFAEVAQMVAKGEVDFGILPFENNSSGAISDTLDLIMSEQVYIVGETYLDIRHCLLGTQDAEISDIQKLYSHQQGFAQSRAFLAELGDDVLCTPMDNTAFAAEYVANSGDKHKGAIASRLAAETFGLKILKENIHENDGNTTRFVVIANKLIHSDRCDKISGAFVARHKSGALCDVLALFAKNSINLLHIESRPRKGKDFSYLFYVDFEGNLSSQNVNAVISGMEEVGADFYLLGHYQTQKQEK